MRVGIAVGAAVALGLDVGVEVGDGVGAGVEVAGERVGVALGEGVGDASWHPTSARTRSATNIVRHRMVVLLTSKFPFGEFTGSQGRKKDARLRRVGLRR